MKRLQSEKGSALVEFAIILPVFLLVVVASITFVWLLGARSAVTGAARDGARYASIQHDWMDCPASGVCYTGYPTPNEVETYVKDRAGVFGVDAVTLTPSVVSSDASTQHERNEIITVTARRTLPNIFGTFASLFGVQDITYTSTAVARAE